MNHFLAASWLLLLVPVAVLAASYLVLQRRRRHYAVKFTNLELLDTVAPNRPGWRRHLPAGAAALALVSLVTGLARPAHAAEVPKESAVVLLAIDISGSMEATDVAPDRLTAAVDAAADFVDSLPDGFQVGLVAFDRTARVVTPATTDHDAVVAALDRLQLGEGTAAGEGILAALTAIDDARAASGVELASTTTATDEPVSATVILLSDGASTEGTDVTEAATQAADTGVPVSTITYGTAGGTVDIDGQTIPVPPDTASMAAIADSTGGTAFTAATGDELASVYSDIQARVGTVTETQELSRWFTGAAVVLLAGACAASLLWTGRFL